MRKSVLLLPLLLIPGFVSAHVSDAAYCANALGMPNGPYRCFNSLEGAEEWIRQDDGSSDGYALLTQAPARATGNSNEVLKIKLAEKVLGCRRNSSQR